MAQRIDPIASVSLKDACIAQLEGLILAGDFAPGWQPVWGSAARFYTRLS